MTVANDFTGHRTFTAWARYETPDQIAVTGKPHIWVFQNDHLLGLRTPAEVKSLIRALTPPGRDKSRDGVPWVITAPADVALAMKDAGLMPTAEAGYRFFAKVLRPTLREMSRVACGLTTENGVRALVPVSPYYVVSAGAGTRDGRASLEWNVWVVHRAPAADGRVLAINHRVMAAAQAPAQAACNQALGHALLKRGVLLVPNGKSVGAVGYAANTPGADRVNAAAGARPAAAGGQQPDPKQQPQQQHQQQQSQQNQQRQARPQKAAPATAGTKARSRSAGPRAKKAAAKMTRPAKVPVDWRTALHNLSGTVNTVMTKTVRDSLVRLDRSGQRWLARRAIRAAYRYHCASGAARFTEASVRHTARHLALPHVGPRLFDRQWAKLAGDPDRLGVRVVRDYGTGNRMLAPTAQVGLEQRVGNALAAAARTPAAGLSKRKVTKALAGSGLTTAQYVAAQGVAGPGRVVFSNPYQRQGLAHGVAALTKAGRDLYVLGDRALAKQLGGESFSVNGFLDSTRRTGHLRSLWLGLRSECWLTGSPLKAAEFIRAAKPRVQLRRGSVVVVSPKSLDEVRGVGRLLELAERRDCKLIVTGPHAAQYRSLTYGRGAHP